MSDFQMYLKLYLFDYNVIYRGKRCFRTLSIHHKLLVCLTIYTTPDVHCRCVQVVEINQYSACE